MTESDNLEALKRQWYDEAKENGNLSKIRSICIHLGKGISHSYGPKYEFVDGDHKVYVDDYGGYFTMNVGKREVLSTHSERLYVKDICDAFIEKHYPAAAKVIVEKAEKTEAKKKAKLHKQLFG